VPLERINNKTKGKDVLHRIILDKLSNNGLFSYTIVASFDMYNTLKHMDFNKMSLVGVE